MKPRDDGLDWLQNHLRHGRHDSGDTAINRPTDYIGHHRRIAPVLWALGNRPQQPHHPDGWDSGR